jgi:S-adenosylmethionine-dependent methyltransferase
MSKLPKDPLDPKIKHVQKFYDQGGEWDRKDRHPVEFAVTERILGEYLPPVPAKILDMGGGPGRYAFHLVQLGYAVTLADLSPANIDFAISKSEELNLSLENILVHDATKPIPFQHNYFDAVLLMGPLYHLTTYEQRLAALRNALNVLKSGGILFTAFITMFGALRSIVLNAPNQLPAEWRTMKNGLNDANLGFTEAYFARVNEIEALMTEAGCQYVEMIGCEGFSVIAEQSFVETEMDDDVWQHWVDLNLEFGRHRTALEASDHILYVARKP